MAIQTGANRRHPPDDAEGGRAAGRGPALSGFTVVHVFGVAVTTGEPLPEVVPVLLGGLSSLWDALARQWLRRDTPSPEGTAHRPPGAPTSVSAPWWSRPPERAQGRHCGPHLPHDESRVTTDRHLARSTPRVWPTSSATPAHEADGLAVPIARAPDHDGRQGPDRRPDRYARLSRPLSNQPPSTPS